MLKNKSFKSCLLLGMLFGFGSVNAFTNEKISFMKDGQSKFIDNGRLTYKDFSVLKKEQKEEKIKEIAKVFNIETEKKKIVDVIKEIQKEVGLSQTGEFDEITALKFFNYKKDFVDATLPNYLSDMDKIIEDVKKRNAGKFLIVNIPSMTLDAYEIKEGVVSYVMSSPVIVGKRKTQTPITTFDIRGIKYNPDWNPTQNMLKRNVYKADEFNTVWLEKHNVIVYDADGNKVEYEEMIPGEKYRFRQPSGASNALGILKFETTSPDDIYLHDTNERHLFGKNVRLYSSGCIRVKEFMSLAKFIKNVDDGYLKKKLDTQQTTIEKTESVPVFVTYHVIGKGKDGLDFYPDVYSRIK